MVKRPDKETIVSASDTVRPLSENEPFQQKEADPVGKVKRSDSAPPGEAKWLLSQEQTLGFYKECNSLKESLFENATNLICE